MQLNLALTKLPSTTTIIDYQQRKRKGQFDLEGVQGRETKRSVILKQLDDTVVEDQHGISEKAN